MSNVIFYGLLFLAAVIGYVFRTVISPTVSQIFYELDPEDLSTLEKWALKFCRAAKNIIDLKSGAERRNWVMEQITKLCEKFKINLTEEQKRALLETAYDEMNAEDGAAQAAEVKTITAYLDTTGTDKPLPAVPLSEE